MVCIISELEPLCPCTLSLRKKDVVSHEVKKYGQFQRPRIKFNYHTNLTIIKTEAVQNIQSK